MDIWDVSLYQASFTFLVTAEGQIWGEKKSAPMVSKGIEWIPVVGHFISGNLLHKKTGKSP